MSVANFTTANPPRSRAGRVATVLQARGTPHEFPAIPLEKGEEESQCNASKYLSASSAAMHPVPALVTAWR